MKLGIIGGGQLGRMLALAAAPLNITCRVIDRSGDVPATPYSEMMVGALEDATLLKKFALGLDAVTYEFEHLPVAAIRAGIPDTLLYPNCRALEVGQDRISEKNFFLSLGIPTAPFAPVNSAAELEAAFQKIGLPAVVKTSRAGYDGKGQRVIRTRPDSANLWLELGSVPLIVESFVPFTRELSIIAVRGRCGEVRCYPLVENLHHEGILRRSLAPAPNTLPELSALARDYVTRVLTELQYVGVLTIEFFDVNGELRANEMAPRVHNSGHWTIEGSETSQFENHVRAVCGLPLGSTAARGVTAMLNILGQLPNTTEVLNRPNTHLHLYGKSERPGRKLGHITVTGSTYAEVTDRSAVIKLA